MDIKTHYEVRTNDGTCTKHEIKEEAEDKVAEMLEGFPDCEDTPDEDREYWKQQGKNAKIYKILTIEAEEKSNITLD